MNELVLSASSISEWLRCHRRYMYASVYRLAGGQSLAAGLGSAVHAAAEAFWKRPVRPVEAFRRRMEIELVNMSDEEREGLPEALLDGARMIDTYQARVAPQFTPTMVEQEFLVEVAEVPGVLLAGTIDAATDEDVRDLKTVSMISKFHPESYDLQLSLYALGYEAMTGHRPKRLILDVLPRGGRETYRMYERAPQIGELLDVVGIVRDGIIDHEDYSPTGAMSGACHWCPYSKGICPDARLD